MARGIDFDGSNITLVAPSGMEDAVTSLPVHYDDGLVVSCWRLSADELAEIQRTGVVWLSIIGNTMPPAFVGGHKSDAIAVGRGPRQ